VQQTIQQQVKNITSMRPIIASLIED